MVEVNEMTDEERAEDMDIAGQAAEIELRRIINDGGVGASIALGKIANWWHKWYGEAGHKRLGRIILKFKS